MAGAPPPPPPTRGPAPAGLSSRQYTLATATLLFSSATSGATSMLLLLSSLKAGHSVWQTSLIFAAYQAASSVAALGAGGLLAARGLRPVLVAAFLLQAGAAAALIPLNAREREGPGVGVAWPLATATAYASVINAVSGVARVLARTASKALPKLARVGGKVGKKGGGGGGAAAGGAPAAATTTSAAEAAAATAAAAAAAPRAGRVLMLRTVLITGGRTALKGAGSLLGGALAGHVPYPAAMGALAAATLPAAAIAVLVVPAGAGVACRGAAPAATSSGPAPSSSSTAGDAGAQAKGGGGAGGGTPTTPLSWWGRHLPALAPLSRPVAVTTLAQALQNGGQFAWLQVPLAHLLSSKGAAFRFSRTGTGGAVAAVMVAEGGLQLVTPRLLRLLRQAPPHATRGVVGLWGWLAAVGGLPLILLAGLSAGAGAAGVLGPGSGRAPAAAAFFPSLAASVGPTQVFAALLSFTLQRVMDRGRIGATAGANTAAQAAGRAGGVLASGLIYAAMTGDWRGHARARRDVTGGGDAGAPVGPFAATMGFTVACLVAAAAVARWGLPAGEDEAVRCGPCLGGGGRGDVEGGRRGGGGGAK